jgi:hypothetical protein
MGMADAPRRSEALKKIELYREMARYYFGVRNNVIFLNLGSAGAIAGLFAHSLIDSHKDYLGSINADFWLYVIGCLVVITFAGWAASVCNILTNSFARYMDMAVELEEKFFSADYAPRRTDWAVTVEFLRRGNRGRNLVLDNPWNLPNFLIAIFAAYFLQVIGFATDQAPWSAGALIAGIVILAIILALLAVTISKRLVSSLIVAACIVCVTSVPFVEGAYSYARNCWPTNASKASATGTIILTPKHIR